MMTDVYNIILLLQSFPTFLSRQDDIKIKLIYIYIYINKLIHTCTLPIAY